MSKPEVRAKDGPPSVRIPGFSPLPPLLNRGMALAERLTAPLYARLAALIGLLLLPVVLYSFFSAYSAYREGRSQSQDTARQLSELAAGQEQTLTDSAKKLLTALTSANAVPALLLQSPDCPVRVAAVVHGFKEYSYLGITDSSGRILCSSLSSAVGQDLSGRGWWRQARDSGQIVVSGLAESSLTGDPMVTVAAPLDEPEPSFGGVMFLGIDARVFSGIARQSGLPPQAAAFLVDKAGQTVSPDGLLSLTTLSAESIKQHPSLAALPQPEQMKRVLAGSLRQFADAGLDGIPRLYSVTPLRGSPLMTVVGLPESHLLGWTRHDFLRAALVPLTMMVWALLTAAFAAHFMVARGLRSLSKTARALRRGDYAARPKLRGGPRELRQLADTMTELATRVEQHEKSLSRSLEQKEAMLREIHHRIKNNLQVVTSLMSLQAGRLKDPAAIAAMADLQRRVRSLSLLHRHLYEGDDLRYLDFGQFVAELCQMVKASSGPVAQNVAIEVDIPPIPLGPDRAVPVALLITEALSNALRHGFPAGGGGRVSVGLAASADGRATITIADNGIGWAMPPEGAALAGSSSQGMGMSLMQVFARQLGGELEVQGPPGTTIRFSFALS